MFQRLSTEKNVNHLCGLLHLIYDRAKGTRRRHVFAHSRRDTVFSVTKNLLSLLGTIRRVLLFSSSFFIFCRRAKKKSIICVLATPNRFFRITYNEVLRVILSYQQVAIGVDISTRGVYPYQSCRTWRPLFFYNFPVPFYILNTARTTSRFFKSTNHEKRAKLHHSDPSIKELNSQIMR